MRAGKRRLGLTQRLKVLDRIGFLKTRSLVQSLLPENLARELVAFHARITRAGSEAALLKVISREPNVKLLDATKIAFGLSTDAALANFLALKGHSVSMIRSGKSGLGVLPKLRILQRICREFDADALVKLAESPSELTNAVKAYQRRRAETV